MGRDGIVQDFITAEVHMHVHVCMYLYIPLIIMHITTSWAEVLSEELGTYFKKHADLMHIEFRTH